MDTLFSKIGESKIIAILRGLTSEEAVLTAQALRNGGISFAEVTFDQTHPDTDTYEKICRIKAQCPGLHIGAGTVITMEQLKMAHKAGAEFIISPNTDPDIIRAAKERHMLSMPGAMTPTEIVAAYQYGADIVKVFPSDTLGLTYFKAIRSPISHIPLAAVGGVSLDNVRDFFRTGIYCVGIGSNIVDKEAIRLHDYRKIEKLARSYVQAAQMIWENVI